MRLRVAAVAQLAEELVDEVAAVGEDQRAAGARALDEAERRDGLAGAGRVLEPEALAGVRVLGRLGELLRRRPRRPAPSSSQSCGSSGSSSSSSSSSPGMPGRRERRPRPASGARRSADAPLPDSASSAVSVPDSASTWWAESTVPSTSLRLVLAEQPVEPEQQRPALAPADRRDLGAGVELGQRGVERAPARRCRARARTAASSPSSTNGSRVNAAARSIASSDGGMAGVASTATDVGSAMRLGGMTGREPRPTGARLRESAGRDPRPGLRERPGGPRGSVLRESLN